MICKYCEKTISSMWVERHLRVLHQLQCCHDCWRVETHVKGLWRSERQCEEGNQGDEGRLWVLVQLLGPDKPVIMRAERKDIEFMLKWGKYCPVILTREKYYDCGGEPMGEGMDLKVNYEYVAHSLVSKNPSPMD